MSAKIHVLPGIERRDLGNDIGADTCFEAAKEAGVDPVIVVGVDRSGAFYVASSIAEVDRVVGMLMRAATHLASSEIIHDEVIESN